jgi:hypothetical protein
MTKDLVFLYIKLCTHRRKEEKNIGKFGLVLFTVISLQ